MWHSVEWKPSDEQHEDMAIMDEDKSRIASSTTHRISVPKKASETSRGLLVIARTDRNVWFQESRLIALACVQILCAQ